MSDPIEQKPSAPSPCGTVLRYGKNMGKGGISCRTNFSLMIRTQTPSQACRDDSERQMQRKTRPPAKR